MIPVVLFCSKCGKIDNKAKPGHRHDECKNSEFIWGIDEEVIKKMIAKGNTINGKSLEKFEELEEDIKGLREYVDTELETVMARITGTEQEDDEF